MPNRSEVLLVEDDVATRDWLAAMLAEQPDLHLAQACGTVAEALDWLQQHPVDILLTDLGLPDGSGREVIGRAAECNPACEILVLTIFGDEAHVLSAIDAGAGGYLLKDGSLASVRDHLACLRSGGSPLSPTIARTLIRRTRALQDPTGNPATGPGVAPAVGPQTGTPAGTQRSDDLQGGSSPLSERELQVLIGVSKGFSYLEVAGSLGVSTNTIRTHVRRIYEKLAVNSRAEALYEYNRRRAEQGQPPLR
jgi:DNA-binding NarL/FixJ family response regulator